MGFSCEDADGRVILGGLKSRFAFSLSPCSFSLVVSHLGRSGGVQFRQPLYVVLKFVLLLVNL
jgi:hypothetical protein